MNPQENPELYRQQQIEEGEDSTRQLLQNSEQGLTRYPLPSKNWENRFEEGWDETRTPEPQVLAFIERHKNEIGPKIVDIASGTGRHLLPLVKMGYDVTGAELTKKGIKITQEKLSKEGLKAKLVRADFHHLPFPDESFDAAISTQGMQYNTWEGAQQTFRETARILKPGDLFFFRARSDKAPLRPEAKIIPDERGRTWTEERGPEKSKVILHDYTLEELQDLAAFSGFEIIDDPVDEKRVNDGVVKMGQWNVVFRKKAKV